MTDTKSQRDMQPFYLYSVLLSNNAANPKANTASVLR